MSTTTHNFQIGQRVVVAEPPQALPELAGLAGVYVGDLPDGRLVVGMDINGWTVAYDAGTLTAEKPRTVTDPVEALDLTSAERKALAVTIRARVRGEQGTFGELLRAVLAKLEAMPLND